MRVLLNGVGRIGKAILRNSVQNNSFDIVAINEINTNKENIAYFINYDSTYGRFNDKFIVEDNRIKNKTSQIELLNYSDIYDMDFKRDNIDIVIDASGSKVDVNRLRKLDIKAVFLTHPNQDADINVVMGVNDHFIKQSHKIISTSSCNATALLPLLKLLDDNYEIQYGNITTIHPLLNHQKVLDSACVGSNDREVECNFEFGRSSTQNIIPSGTTTIEACSYILSNINSNIISSNSFRVSTSTVGAIDVTLFVNKDISKDQLIEFFKECEQTQTQKVLLNNFEPLVSSDFQSQEYTTIIDHRFTDVKSNKMVKLVVWYDNEWGYASKVTDIVTNYIDNYGFYDKI